MTITYDLIKKAYEAHNIETIKKDNNLFVSLREKGKPEALVYIEEDFDFSNKKLAEVLLKFSLLKEKYSTLSNIFLFSRNIPNIEVQKDYALFGIRCTSLEYPLDLLKKKENGALHIELLAHNYVASQEIIEYSKEHNKIGVVRATGTGKSFVIADLISREENKKILLLSPSNLIFDQFEKYFGEEFISKIDTVTYNKLTKESSKDILDTSYDFIFIDEYHRCGASIWETFVKEIIELNATAKIIGFTATDKRHLDGNRDMTEELFDGNICSKLTLSDSIISGTLKAPYYVSALYKTDEMLDSLEKRIKKLDSYRGEPLMDELKEFKIKWDNINSMSGIFKKHLNTNESYKFIVFCTDVNHSIEMSHLLKEWFLGAGFNNVYTTEVNYTNKDNIGSISEFENQNLKNGDVSLLITVSILNEGVRCKGCRGVIFARGTKSNIIYSQQLGRALSSNSKFTPIVFDLMNNFRSVRNIPLIEDIQNSLKFKNSIRKKYKQKEESFVWDIYDETQEPYLLFESLNQKLSYDWYDWFNVYSNYVTKYKNSIVDKSFEDKGLYRWVVLNRTLYRKGLLDSDKKELLDSKGFIFDPNDVQWWDGFYKWLNFVNTNDREPSTSTDDKEEVKIAKWSFYQRRLNNGGRIREDRKEVLNKNGFKWSLRNQDWETNLKLMESQIKERGHSKMLTKDIKCNPVYYWHKRILKEFTDGVLEESKINELKKIGFEFPSDDIMLENKNISSKKGLTNIKSYDGSGYVSTRTYLSFNQKLALYIQYKNEFGRTNVRLEDERNNPVYAGLSNWYKGIRRKNGIKISTEQYDLLKKEGFFD